MNLFRVHLWRIGITKYFQRRMNAMNVKQLATILAHALVGWALCAATMGIGMATMPIQTTLIVHAIGAPVFFTIVSLVYFRKFNYTAPLQTALIFVGFVITVDFFVVSLLILKSLEMFTSPLGTWIPFALIFASTYLTGLFTVKRRVEKPA
jgi:hypothetical protein